MTLYGLAVLTVLFGAGLAFADVVLLLLTPALLRRIGRLAPQRRPGTIAAARFAPVVAAYLMVGLIFLPAWLRHEPHNSGEEASLLLLVVALVSTLPLLAGVNSAVFMFLRTRDRLRLWRLRSESPSRSLAPFEVVEVRSADLSLCVGGYLKPTIYASTAVIRSLDPDELKAALAHEVSHASARDPLRRLGMSACPDFLRLLDLDHAWRLAFARACEFAADARASAGRPEVALDLASALLKVARLHGRRAEGALALADVAVSPAFSSRLDLEARIEALANPPKPQMRSRGLLGFLLCPAALLLIAGLGAIRSAQIHDLTEAVGRFLAP